jgi:hypothetical protein
MRTIRSAAPAEFIGVGMQIVLLATTRMPGLAAMRLRSFEKVDD